jgi:hypothetical protein
VCADANCDCGVSVSTECSPNNMAQPKLDPDGARAAGHIPAELCKAMAKPAEAFGVVTAETVLAACLSFDHTLRC